MRYAIVDNGIVINIAEAEEALHTNWVQSDSGNIGDVYDGSQFVRPTTAPPPVPESITNWQAKKQLLIEGVYEQVSSAISTMDAAVQIDWIHAAVFRRDYPLIQQMQAMLGRTDSETDEYFVAASKLQ